MATFRRPLAPGYEGIRQTVRAIYALSVLGQRSRAVRIIAERVQGVPLEGLPQTLDRTARAFLKYELDPFDVELVHGVDRLIERGRGDCDDFTVFLSSVGLALGLPARITIARTRGFREFNHVFPEFLLANRWRPVDATDDQTPPGERSPKIIATKSFPFRRRHYGDGLAEIPG